MPSVDEIRTLTIKAITDGMDSAVADINKVSAAQGNLAVVSDTSTRATTSVASALEKQTRQLDQSYRTSQQFNSAQLTLTRGFNEGMISLDRFNQLSALNADRFGQSGTAAKAFAAASSSVSGQLVAMAAGMGPVGVFLSAIPGWGLPAALALTAISSAIHYVAEESARMGDKAIQMQQFKDVTGLTIANIGALRNAGTDLGITGDQVTARFEKLTGGLNDAHRATGTLYDDVRMVNAGLADQLQRSVTTAQGIDALAKAYQQAGNDSAKAAIAQAAFGGRGGAAFGPLLGAIADAGGIDNLTQHTKLLGEATDDENKRWASMKAQIDDTTQRAQNILASIFTQQGLQAALLAAQTMERAAIAAKELSKSQTASQSTFFQQNFLPKTGVTGPTLYSEDPSMQGNINDTLNKALQDQEKYIKDVLSVWADYDAKLGGVANTVTTTAAAINGMTAAIGRLNQSTKEQQDTAIATSSKWNDYIAFLGAGATISEKFDARLSALYSTYMQNKTGLTNVVAATDAYNRAVAAINLEKAIAQSQALIGVLGVSATLAQQVAARFEQIEKQRAELAGSPSAMTDAQETTAKRVAKAQIDGTFALQANIDAMHVQTATIGMSVAAGETYSLIQTKINENLNAGRPAMDGINDRYLRLAAAAGIAKQAQAAAAAQDKANFDLQTIGLSDIDRQIAAVQKSLHGNDWQSWMNDGLSAQLRLIDGMKQFGDMSSTALSGFINDWKNGSSAIDAMHNALLNLSNTLVQMATQQLVRAALGGFASSPTFLSFFGVGGTSGGAVAGADVGGAAGAFSLRSGGMVGIDGTPTYVHTAYFENAPRFDMGGIITDDGVPIIAHPGERILNRSETAAYNSGAGGNSGPNITYAPTIDARGADAAAVARLASALAEDRKAFASNVLTVVAKARTNLQLPG